MWVILNFGIWGIFLQGEKFLGAKICASIGVEFLAVESIGMFALALYGYVYTSFLWSFLH
jgi:hypothetical protein